MSIKSNRYLIYIYLFCVFSKKSDSDDDFFTFSPQKELPKVAAALSKVKKLVKKMASSDDDDY